MQSWFAVEQIASATWCISEYGHWEQTHCYLLCGQERALLIDTGLGLSDISAVVRTLTDLPVAAVATHVHWDHIGGHRYYPEFYAHPSELPWLQGKFPLPLAAVRAMATDCESLPEGFDPYGYQLFQGTPAHLLRDGEIINLGGRTIVVFHTPGHSPGHLCFWEADTGYLFTGDLVYAGTLYANYPSTDPSAYLASLEKIAELPATRIFPGHHSLLIDPELVTQIRDALRRLNEQDLLQHGSGEFVYDNWAISL